MKREFDRKIWKSGNSFVVTIPSETVERYALEGKFITVAISDNESLILTENKKNSDKTDKKKEKDK